jgi:hypothetical protein
MALSTRRVVRIWQDQQMLPCVGVIRFELAGPLEDVASLRLVVPSPVDVPLDADGLMTYDAPTTDIGGGATYKVSPRIQSAAGEELWCSNRSLLRPFYVLIPPGAGDLELPPPTFPTTGYVAVQGPAGAGVLYLLPGESIPPGTVPPMLVVQPAT